jgi:hypothetical protein
MRNSICVKNKIIVFCLLRNGILIEPLGCCAQIKQKLEWFGRWDDSERKVEMDVQSSNKDELVALFRTSEASSVSCD